MSDESRVFEGLWLCSHSLASIHERFVQIVAFERRDGVMGVLSLSAASTELF